ncbi:hypothetical protein ACFXA3_00250 [Streptomyces sp. NPDC059456]|uniref:hypothetical protein n=1 Tax=Streptomyces sp. NPDC059456 TaxID=3346838 RepID=UPI00367BF673
MSRHQVEIHQDSPDRYRVLVDGVDIAQGLAGLSLRMSVGMIPRLDLDLQLIDVTQLGSIEAEVMLTRATHEALVALGWTPPEEPA